MCFYSYLTFQDKELSHLTVWTREVSEGWNHRKKYCSYMQHLIMVASNVLSLKAELVDWTRKQVCSSPEIPLPFGIALRSIDYTFYELI